MTNQHNSGDNYAPVEIKEKKTHLSFRINIPKPPKWLKHTLLHMLNTTCSFLLYALVLQPWLAEPKTTPEVAALECPAPLAENKTEPEKVEEEKANEAEPEPTKVEKALKLWETFGKD